MITGVQAENINVAKIKKWKNFLVSIFILLLHNCLKSTWVTPYPNLPDGYQRDPMSLQSPNQADQPGVIHDNIEDRSRLLLSGDISV